MKKGNAGIVVLIVALFITIIALCGVVLYYNLDSNNSNVEQNDNENNEINNEQANNNNENTNTNTQQNTNTTTNNNSSNTTNNNTNTNNQQTPTNNNASSNQTTTNNSNTNGTGSNIEQKDAKYFDEYLEPFKGYYAINITKNTEKFTDEDLYYFVMSYYIKKSKNDNSYSINNSTLMCSYEVSKSEIDQLVSKYFNKSITNYGGLDLAEETGVTKINTGKYKIVWYGGAVSYEGYINPVVTYNGQNVSVKYDIYNYLSEQTIGAVTFKLKYNSGNYYIVKVEESKTEESLVEEAKEQLAGITQALQNQIITSYNDRILSGAEVIAACQQYKNSDISVRIVVSDTKQFQTGKYAVKLNKTDIDYYYSPKKGDVFVSSTLNNSSEYVLLNETSKDSITDIQANGGVSVAQTYYSYVMYDKDTDKTVGILFVKKGITNNIQKDAI